MIWPQDLAPVRGSAGLSAAVAALPLVVIFTSLAVFRLKASTASALALAFVLCLSIGAWGMPAKLALLAAAQGAAFGMFPVFFLVLATLFLFNLTVRTGQFEVIRASIAGITPDRRLQALLIAFCFGAFIEGAAGFGAPVAIAGATLAGLGFRPFYAASLCLVANTAPVAFGSIGIPIVAMGGVMGLNEEGLMKLSIMVGHQLPLISLIIPLYLVLLMAGLRKAIEVLPAIAVCGGSFAVCQWATASFIGPYLPDLVASIASMLSLVLLLRVWTPKTVFRFSHEPAVASPVPSFPASRLAWAWTPYLALMSLVLLWGMPPVKAALGRATVIAAVPGLDNAISRAQPEAAGAVAAGLVPAKFKFDFLAAGGTAVLMAAILSAGLCRLPPRETLRIFGRTARDLRSPAATIASILALAYLMNASGMTPCLGVLATRTGRLFPLISPVLGWLGVFLTGSDTSSNVLFGGLQKTAAERLGLNPFLTAAANTSGGVMGKMISPQSIAVACAATKTTGEEGPLFRFALKHSVLLLALVCGVVYLQAYVLTWMVP